MSPLNQGFFLPALYQSSSKLVTYATHDAGQSLHGKCSEQHQGVVAQLELLSHVAH